VTGPFTDTQIWFTSVAFSPGWPAHRSQVQTIGQFECGICNRENRKQMMFDFTDHFMINDEGWMCGSKGELLIWIPSVT